MIGVIKGTMRQKKEVNGLPLPIASYKANMKAPIRSLKVAITATQSGSGDPSPDNIRPISGVSECNVVRCGTNVWDEEWEVGSIDNNNGQPWESAGMTRIRSKNFIKAIPNTVYCLTNLSGISSYAYFYDIDKNFISYSGGSLTDNYRLFTTPINCYFVKFRTDDNYGTTYNNDISINYPSTDHDYHVYNGNTYTIQLGDTYYGGSLDVTTGVLTVNKVAKLIKDCSWTYRADSTSFITTSFSDKAPLTADMICSIYQTIDASINTTYMPNYSIKGHSNPESASTVILKDFRYTSENDLIAGVGDIPIAYNLATPITVQLTPTQVEQLLGANNVWADTGAINELIYTDRQVYYGR